jgi:methylaspartate ammonia-lyase
MLFSMLISSKVCDCQLLLPLTAQAAALRGPGSCTASQVVKQRCVHAALTAAVACMAVGDGV